jgi:nucleoside-diphosphate-sugar epimerase
MNTCLTGAIGYVGGRLAPQLPDAGHTLRCLVREARKLDSRPWRARAGIEVVEAELHDGHRSLDVTASAEMLFCVIGKVGGGHGYHAADCTRSCLAAC